MRFRLKHLIPTLAVAGSLGGSVLVATAQDYDDTPRVERLQAALNDDRVLFQATVNQQPDDDLLELGQLVAMGGGQQGGSGMACIACHGARGQGDGSGAFPRIAGQAGWYMYKQLNDFASGTRPNEIMTGIAQRLSDEEREAVSAYYAAIDAPVLPTSGQVTGETLQWGGQLGAVGSEERGIPACINCHGPQGTGMAPSVPYLAGQDAAYMAKQLTDWRDGLRDNDPMNVMSAIAAKMTDEDITAVSEYYARVGPQVTAAAPQ